MNKTLPLLALGAVTMTGGRPTSLPTQVPTIVEGVTREKIERVDLMYGHSSAAYPGNTAGALVDSVTCMPTTLEAHAKSGDSSQPAYDFTSTGDGPEKRGGPASAGTSTRPRSAPAPPNFAPTRDSHTAKD